MPKRILLLEGHPDPDSRRFGHVLSAAYARGAAAAGHNVKRIRIAELDFPVIRTRDEWALEAPPQEIEAAQEEFAWAQHIVVFYPIWFGTVPALLKAFFEQVLRPGFAVPPLEPGKPPGSGLLKGRTARVVVTTGTPTIIFWLLYAGGVRLMSRNLLAFAGIAPVRSTVVGGVETPGPRHERWIRKFEQLGRSAA